ncbi:MAG: hypothetical protein O2931_16585 [Planctomycetota bacterium]|nr:hypothetical protein [Planctomycetota bacterium]MDA1180398.1 hypothetical protein [Planctomycetota bacterium]
MSRTTGRQFCLDCMGIAQVGHDLEEIASSSSEMAGWAVRL